MLDPITKVNLKIGRTSYTIPDLADGLSTHIYRINITNTVIRTM